MFAPAPPPIVANLLPRCGFSVSLKNNRHDTCLACRNSRRDRTRVHLDDIVVTVASVSRQDFSDYVSFGRERKTGHYSDDMYSYNTFATLKPSIH